MKTIGERVRAMREQRQLTQLELAKAAGVSKNAISKIERGETKRPNPDTLFAIADRLGVPDRWIIKGGESQAVAEEAVPYGLSEREWRVVQALRMLTPSQQDQTWKDIQDAEHQNREILTALGKKPDAA